MMTRLKCITGIIHMATLSTNKFLSQYILKSRIILTWIIRLNSNTNKINIYQKKKDVKNQLRKKKIETLCIQKYTDLYHIRRKESVFIKTLKNQCFQLTSFYEFHINKLYQNSHLNLKFFIF